MPRENLLRQINVSIVAVAFNDMFWVSTGCCEGVLGRSHFALSLPPV
jgi:hypothetical protein